MDVRKKKKKGCFVLVVFVSIVFLAAGGVSGDTPANCTYEDIRGTWVFSETERSSDQKENCTTMGPVVHQLVLHLDFPDVASDERGNVGHWTLVYNQGFEVTINQRKYFAFSYYEEEQNGSAVTSFCHKTFHGWSHDVLVRNWACYAANKLDGPITSMITKHYATPTSKNSSDPPTRTYQSSIRMIDHINAMQKSWTATLHKRFQGMPLEAFVRMRGGRSSSISFAHTPPPKPSPVTEDVRRRTSALPEQFDWRDVNGMDYVSPVRDQGGCGSCYAFSSTAMIEARLRVATNNSMDVVLSPQQVVDCSEYSQGCEGGFPYLIAGKYAQDFGLVDEKCYPYRGADGQCKEDEKGIILKGTGSGGSGKEKPCLRHYVSEYRYVGGFYGGCNEELMKEALVSHGPLSVSFFVYDDFSLYSGGIYHHTGVTQAQFSATEGHFDPFEVTNHAVLLVGYGVDSETGEKFWSVKNSWGGEWGEKGFFRIRRGADECSIESLAVEALPIP